MSKNLTILQAVNKFIERTKITKRISFYLDDLEDIFGDANFHKIEINGKKEMFDWEHIIPYLDELSDVEEAFFELYYEDDGAWNGIPEDLEKLTNLKRLNIAYQHDITYIPYGIRNLRNIEIFNIAGNKLTEFPQIFYSLPKLKQIGIVKNNFSILDIFYEITNIKKQSNPYKHEHTVLNETISSIYEIIIKYYIESKKYEVIEKKWGVTIKKQNYTIFFFYDAQIEHRIDKNNIAICVEQKKDTEISKFEILCEIQDLFNKIKNNTNKIGKLYYISSKRFYENDIISYSELFKTYKEGKKEISNYSVYDAILKFGGRELFEKFEEQKKQDIARASKFFSSNNNLEKIEIENFKLFKNIKVVFSDSINVIIGKNGYGKTSLLQAIAIGLVPIQHDEYEAKHRIIYKKFINKNVFVKLKTTYEQFATIKLNWANFVQSYKIHTDTLTLNENSDILPTNYLVLAYGANLFSNEKKNYDQIISRIIEEDGKNYSIYSVLEDYTEHFYNPLTVLQILTDKSPSLYPKKAKEINQKVKLIIDTLNIFLNIQEPETYKVELNKSDNNIYIRGKYYFTNKKGRWELNELSEGYRKNILLITDILLRIISAKISLLPDEPIKNIFKKVRGTILIDEYDKHLHATWQRELIFHLKQTFENLQFILTTHNVFSLQSAEGENAIIINTKDDKLNITSTKITNGLSLESIYNEYFDGGDKFFGFITEILFEKFYKFLKEKRKKRNEEKGDLSEEGEKEFRNITNELLSFESSEIKGIVTREIRQFERKTGKTIEL